MAGEEKEKKKKKKKKKKVISKALRELKIGSQSEKMDLKEACLKEEILKKDMSLSNPFYQ